MNNRKINIAIDGPSGAGKSTIAKVIAQKLDLVFINTGLMYRAIAFYCISNSIDLLDEDKILEEISKISINLLPNERIEINDEDITENLWVDLISVSASKVAKFPKVREFCVHKQRQIAHDKPGVVMEGRDIGSVVLKDADLKIFLTASNEARAERRAKQLVEKGQIVDLDDVMKNIIERDKRDSERETAPLIKVHDAIEIDTSNLTLDEVIEKIIDLATKKKWTNL